MRDLSDKAVLEKAQARGDETFTLVGRDQTSPKVICEWIKLNIETCPEDKLREALERAIKMRNIPSRRYAD
jgi:hypothetical protein